MRVLIEITSGPSAGRKTVLGAGQVVQVGRTEWADFAVAHDARMSSVHFSLETDKTACYLKDLGSTNGTWLNGRQVAETSVVRSGDEIRAGDTLFSVRVEGPSPDDGAGAGLRAAAAETGAVAVAEEGVAPILAAPAAPEAAATRRRATVGYTAQRCDSSLTLCRGHVAEIHPADVAHLLSQHVPLSLIVDFRKLGTPPPADLAERAFLFDWLSAEAAAVASPLLLAQNDTAAWPELLAAGWGNDAVICLFSKQDKCGLLEHLRHCMRVKPKREDASAGMIGLCWPSVLAMLLAHGQPAVVRQLLLGIEAVLVEVPDLPDAWEVYGDSQVHTLLDRLGFVQKTQETTANTL